MKVHEIERNIDLKFLKIKAEFKTNCYVGDSIKVFVIKGIRRIPYFFRIQIGGENFIWEYDPKSLKKVGDGIKQKEIMNVLRLQ